MKVYDCSKNKQVFQAYLKNRLNCTLLMGHDMTTNSDRSDDDSFDSADEDVVEDFLDSSGSSDNDSDDEVTDEGNTYHDMEPSHSKKKFSGSNKNSNNKKQKRQ